MQVIIYGRSDCEKCSRVKQLIANQKGIELLYKDLDTDLQAKDKYAQEYYELSNNSIPVIVINQKPFLSITEAILYIKRRKY